MKSKFANQNFEGVEVLSKEEKSKVVGGYYHNCPGLSLSSCLSSLANSPSMCYALCRN